jgi:hypothetical protein
MKRKDTRRWSEEAEGPRLCGVAAAIIGGAVVGGIASSMAAGKASDAQENAANTASATTMAQYNQNRADAQPWRDAGTAALGQLTAGTAAGGDFNKDFTLADFNQDPGYQFRMDQGMQGAERSAAARGGLLNGGTLKALDRYNQDYASGEYSNAYNRFNNDRTQRFNRLSSLAGTGQTATRDVANMGTNAATEVGNNTIGAGNAQASGYVGQANAVNSGVSSLSNFYLQRQMMQPQQQWYGGGTSSGTRGSVNDSVQLSDGSTFFG